MRKEPHEGGAGIVGEADLGEAAGALARRLAPVTAAGTGTGAPVALNWAIAGRERAVKPAGPHILIHPAGIPVAELPHARGARRPHDEVMGVNHKKRMRNSR